MNAATRRVLAKLPNPRHTLDGWKDQCPVCGRTLTVVETTGIPVIRCEVHGHWPEIITRLGLSQDDLVLRPGEPSEDPTPLPARRLELISDTMSSGNHAGDQRHDAAPALALAPASPRTAPSSTPPRPRTDHADVRVDGYRLGEDDVDAVGYFVSAAELAANPAMLAPPPFVIPKRSCEGRATLLVGREKLSGKTTFELYGAAKKSAGGVYLGERLDAANVLIVGLDEAVGDTLTTLARFGADLSRIRLCAHRPPAKQTVSVIRAEVEAFRPALVIIDSLAKLAVGRVKDSNDPDDWEPLLVELVDIARDFGCALEITAHATKSTGEFRGSTAIAAGADFVLTLTAEERGDTKRKITVEGRRKFPDYEVRLENDDFVLVTAVVEPLEVKVLAYVRAHPGQSQNAMVQGIGGRTDKVLHAIQVLMNRDLVVDRPNRQGWHQYFASQDVPDPVLDRRLISSREG